MKSFSKQLRKDQTPSEREMCRFLKENYPNHIFKRQKPIDNFIVDFYCKKTNLVMEIDGDVHLLQRGKDIERDNLLLHKFNLKTIRFTNGEVFKYRDYIKRILDNVLH